VTIDYQGVHSITDEGLADLTNALVKNSVLKELAILGDDELTNINEGGWVTFSNVLRNPRSALTKLSLLNNSITDNAMQSFADVLVANTNNSKLRNLDFSGNNEPTETGWVTFFAVLLRNPNSAVKILHLNYTSINDNVMLSFTEVLNRLQELIICNNYHVTTAGWIQLSRVLRNPDSALRKLSIKDNSFEDVVVGALTMALAGNNRLKELVLSHNNEVTEAGWMQLSTLLRSALEVIELRGIHINNDIMFAFAEASTNNQKLRELVLELDDENNITIEGYEAFARILCNKSSIRSTFTSNHTLEKLCRESNDSLLPENLKLLLRSSTPQDNQDALSWTQSQPDGTLHGNGLERPASCHRLDGQR